MSHMWWLYNLIKYSLHWNQRDHFWSTAVDPIFPDLRSFQDIRLVIDVVGRQERTRHLNLILGQDVSSSAEPQGRGALVVSAIGVAWAECLAMITKNSQIGELAWSWLCLNLQLYPVEENIANNSYWGNLDGRRLRSLKPIGIDSFKKKWGISNVYKNTLFNGCRNVLIMSWDISPSSLFYYHYLRGICCSFTSTMRFSSISLAAILAVSPIVQARPAIPSKVSTAASEFVSAVCTAPSKYFNPIELGVASLFCSGFLHVKTATVSGDSIPPRQWKLNLIRGL